MQIREGKYFQQNKSNQIQSLVTFVIFIGAHDLIGYKYNAEMVFCRDEIFKDFSTMSKLLMK